MTLRIILTKDQIAPKWYDSAEFTSPILVFYFVCITVVKCTNKRYHSKRRRQWHPTPVLSPGKSHGRRSLVGCSPWGREESQSHGLRCRKDLSRPFSTPEPPPLAAWGPASSCARSSPLRYCWLLIPGEKKKSWWCASVVNCWQFYTHTHTHKIFFLEGTSKTVVFLSLADFT